ncbi:MAG: hypothetical protein A4E64_01081 [Syntrophorhabdus sp. PtaU1.Bin058]|nr:MAG: hypothetical protein A4E64_01081 [Syntrophorhabdus sp. PtaU1.Bin058]
MWKKVVFSGIALVIGLFMITTAFAAYEFYVLKLSTKGKVMDWSFVEKSARSVPGVEKVEVDKGKGTISIFCKEKCTDRIQAGIEGKLKIKGIEGQKLGGVQTVPGGAFPKVETKTSPVKVETKTGPAGKI